MAVLIMQVSAVSGTLSERYGHRLVGGEGSPPRRSDSARCATLGPIVGSCSYRATLVIGGEPRSHTPATNAIIASLPRAKQGVASAVNDTARELGAAFGVAVLGSAFNTGYRHHIDSHSSQLPTGVIDQAREAPAIAVQLAERTTNSTALINTTRDAFTIGMRYAVIAGAAILLLGALFVWFHGASSIEIEEEEAVARLRLRPRCRNRERRIGPLWGAPTQPTHRPMSCPLLLSTRSNRAHSRCGRLRSVGPVTAAATRPSARSSARTFCSRTSMDRRVEA